MDSKKAFFLFASLLLSQPTFAANVEAGKAKAKICAACHGVNGIAVIPGYPNLAGQNAQYLVSSLNAYKNGLRTGAMASIMKAQSMMLSDEDIANIAAYYAQLK